MPKDIGEQEITFQGYESVSTSSRIGGVIIYCKKDDELKYWILLCKAVNNDNNPNILIAAICRSPGYSESEFCDIYLMK